MPYPRRHMRLHRRTLALVSATAALTSTAVFAAAGPASADPRPAHNPGMTRMHELMRDGNPGMMRMHELMRDGNPGMMRMHERTMTGSGAHGMHGMHSH